MTVEENLGPDWAKFLPKAEELLTPIRNTLNHEMRIGMKLYPAKGDIFKVFRETKPSEVNVIWLGQDPYASPEGQATGRAFECGKYPSPSWRKIMEIYKKEIPEPSTLVIQGVLDEWVKSGVFLLNKALTVREKMPNSHTKLWEPFIQYVIATLLNDIQHPKAIILLGQEAIKTIPRAVPPHKIFSFEHPAASSYQGRSWKGDGLFVKTKEFLNFHEINFNW